MFKGKLSKLISFLWSYKSVQDSFVCGMSCLKIHTHNQVRKSRLMRKYSSIMFVVILG